MIEKKKRVLVWGLSNNLAGTERVVESVVLASEGIIFDFLCYEEPSNYPHLFEGDFEDNSFFLLPMKIKDPVGHRKALKQFFSEHGGDYDALWFNANDLSNIDILKMAAVHDFKHRILHSHNSGIHSFWITRVFSTLNKKSAQKKANIHWACSKEAGEYVFDTQDFTVFPNIVDSEKNAFDTDARKRIRGQFGIKEEERVIGSIGRLAEQKNYAFMLSLMPQLLNAYPQTKLLIVGEGGMRDNLEKQAKELGIEENVILAGSKSNTNEFLSAFDVFVLPSLFEGLGLSLIEAQFNGLPSIASSVISDEACISDAVERISLEDRDAWVDLLLSSERKPVVFNERADFYDSKHAKENVAKMFSFLNELEA